MHYITLVHGTWGRGLFIPKSPRPPEVPPRWFEEDSEFCRQLGAQLAAHGIAYKISSFPWSGANSIDERAAAAALLARQLAETIKADRDGRHVIIGHSHGGNVALQALDTPKLELANVRLVTLATPFLDFFPPAPVASKWVVGVIEFMMSLTVIALVAAVLRKIGVPIGEYGVRNISLSWVGLQNVIVVGLVLGAFAFLHALSKQLFHNLGLAELSETELLRQDEDFTAKVKNGRHFPILVLRGVDDEASLGLGFGAFGARLTRILAFAVAWGWLGLLAIIPLGALIVWIFSAQKTEGAVFLWTLLLAFGWAPLAIAVLLLAAIGCKTFFGREFLFGSVPSAISVNSVPDAANNVSIVTLPGPAEQRYWLLHCLYQHPACAKVIAAWLSDGPSRHA